MLLNTKFGWRIRSLAGTKSDTILGMEEENNFGQWLKHRRRRLDLTQQQLADCAACSVVTIRKFETGERRPSRALAELLANCLTIPAHEQETFVDFARGLRQGYETAAPESSSSPAPPATSLRTSLPVPPTPFVGRTVELAQIARLLAVSECRLLTLVGPGGMGKTRLALAAAKAQTDPFPDGVTFVSLTAVADPTHLPQTIANSIGITLTGAEEPADQLGRVLQNKRRLLVLDNFEQLLDGAEVLAGWLRQAPHTKWLVTSRERLNLVEEWLLPVLGFEQSDPGVALFVQSARRIQPDFSLAGQETAVAQICHYVGGMPLAIELAVGWTAMLSCEQILAQMQQTFDFLSTSLRNVPQRHRSLRHLFDQTWQLLPAAEQKVLMKLSVFHGGFAQAGAEAVAGTSLPLLLALANKSLITTNGHGRYDLHEVTRQYAAGKLGESGEESAVRQQHFQSFLTLAEAFEQYRGGPDAITWFRRVAEEQDNFRAALKWVTDTRASGVGSGESMLRLVDCLWWFWFRRGHWQEAERWFLMALELAETGDNPQRCRTLLYLSTIIALQGRYGEATPYLMEAMAIARRLDDPETLALALIVLGQALPDADQGVATFLEARTLLERAGALQQPRVLALLHNLLGERLHENGRTDEAASSYQESLALYRQIGNVDLITYPLGNLGRLALRHGRLAEAHNLITESITLSRSIGNRQGVADWLIPFARVRLYEGDATSAKNHLQEALVLHREMNNKRGQAEAMTGLALVALEQKDAAVARYIRGSLTAYGEMRRQTQHSNAALASSAETMVPDFIDCLFIAGLAAAAQEQCERAATLFAIAERWRQTMQHEPEPPLQQKIDEAVTAVRQKLSSDAYERAGTTGQNWSLDDIFLCYLP